MPVHHKPCQGLRPPTLLTICCCLACFCLSCATSRHRALFSLQPNHPIMQQGTRHTYTQVYNTYGFSLESASLWLLVSQEKGRKFAFVFQEKQTNKQTRNIFTTCWKSLSCSVSLSLLPLFPMEKLDAHVSQSIFSCACLFKGTQLSLPYQLANFGGSVKDLSCLLLLLNPGAWRMFLPAYLSGFGSWLQWCCSYLCTGVMVAETPACFPSYLHTWDKAIETLSYLPQQLGHCGSDALLFTFAAGQQ